MTAIDLTKHVQEVMRQIAYWRGMEEDTPADSKLHIARRAAYRSIVSLLSNELLSARIRIEEQERQS